MLAVGDVTPVLVALAHPEQGSYQEAEKAILEFEQNLTLIFPIVEIAGTHPDALVRKLALIFARRYFDRVKTVADEQESMNGFPDFSPLKPLLLEMIQRETVKETTMAICDVIEIFGALVIEFSEWPELPQFAVALLQQQNTFFIGFYLMTCILDALPDEEQQQLLEPVGHISIQCLISDDPEVRKMALMCTDTILDLLEEPEDVLRFPELPDTYRSLAKNCVEVYKNEAEMACVFDSLGQALFSRFPAFDSVSHTFCTFALRIVQDQSLPVPARISVHQLLEYGPNSIPEWYSEQFRACLNATVGLTLEACMAARDMTDYQFAADYLEQLAQVVDSCDFMEAVQACVEELYSRGDPAAQQTALFVLSCVCESCADTIISSPEFFLHLISQGLASPDEFVCLAANDLLRVIAEFGSSCLTPAFDSIVECFLPRLGDLRFMITLEVVLDEADCATSHMEVLVNTLLQMLRSSIDFKENVLGCLAAAMKHASGDALFSLVFPVLIGLLESEPDLAIGVFKCFAIFAQVSPNSVISSLDNILGVMFSIPSELQLSLVESLFRFVEKFPTHMEKYSEACMQMLRAVMAVEYSPDLTLEQRTARSAAIRCWAYLSPCDEEFQVHLKHMLRSGFTSDQSAGSAAVSIAAPAFAASHIDISAILASLLDEIPRQEDKDVAFEMVNAVASLLQIAAPELVAQKSPEIHKLVSDVLTGQSRIAGEGAEMSVIPAVCNVLYYWVSILGQGFAQYLGHYEGIFTRILCGRKRHLKGPIILALAQIGVAIQSQEVVSMAASNAIQSIEMSHVLIRTCVVNALNVLVKAVPASVAEGQGRFKPVIEAIISSACQGPIANYPLFEAAAALWCTCIDAYGWDLNVEILATVFSLLDVDFEDDMGRSGDFAKVCLKLAETGNEAVLAQVKRMAARFFTETEWYYARFPVPLKQNLAQVLRSMSPDEIQQILGLNQRMTQLVLSRVQQL